MSIGLVWAPSVLVGCERWGNCGGRWSLGPGSAGAGRGAAVRRETSDAESGGRESFVPRDGRAVRGDLAHDLARRRARGAAAELADRTRVRPRLRRRRERVAGRMGSRRARGRTPGTPGRVDDVVRWPARSGSHDHRREPDSECPCAPAPDPDPGPAPGTLLALDRSGRGCRGDLLALRQHRVRRTRNRRAVRVRPRDRRGGRDSGRPPGRLLRPARARRRKRVRRGHHHPGRHRRRNRPALRQDLGDRQRGQRRVARPLPSPRRPARRQRAVRHAHPGARPGHAPRAPGAGERPGHGVRHGRSLLGRLEDGGRQRPLLLPRAAPGLLPGHRRRPVGAVRFVHGVLRRTALVVHGGGRRGTRPRRPSATECPRGRCRSRRCRYSSHTARSCRWWGRRPPGRWPSGGRVRRTASRSPARSTSASRRSRSWRT